MLRCKFVAAQPPLTLMSHDEIVNGGRAEPTTEMFDNNTVAAHVQQPCFELSLVDVPRFELGASTMPR